ncbi:MAG: sigma-70 family RNA polymerase sigma factor [Thermoleophilia bacterium]
MTADHPTPSPRDPRLARFDAVFRDRYEELRRFALRAGAADPDDVASDAFAALWRHLDEVREGAERAWLHAAVRRVAANARRAAGRRDALVDELGAEAGRAAAASAPAADPRVEHALAALSASDRELLLLSVWDGLEPAQVAAALGASRATVAVRLHRARGRFRAAYERHEHVVLVPATSAEGGIDAR